MALLLYGAYWILSRPRVEYERLAYAAGAGDISAFENAVRNGVDLNNQAYLPHSWFLCPSYLDIAAERGNLELVRLLLDNGANANTKWGQLPLTPLDSACSGFKAARRGESVSADRKYLPVIQLLVERGARGRTCLESAVCSGSLDAVRILLTTNLSECTVAHCLYPAAVLRYGDILRMLIPYVKNKEILNRAFFDGIITMDQPCAPFVTAVLDAGADPNYTPEGYPKTALHVASENNWPEIAVLLIGKGAKVDAKDGKGRTAVDVAGGEEVRAVLRNSGSENASYLPETLQISSGQRSVK